MSTQKSKTLLYGWIEEGKSKRLEQTKSRGKRVSLLGVYEPGQGFSGFIAGSIRSKEYIEFMDKEAEKAARTCEKEGIVTVASQDNSSVHTCKAVQAKVLEWERKGLFLFQLPPYCSEMNLIEALAIFRKLKQTNFCPICAIFGQTLLMVMPSLNFLTSLLKFVLF